MEVGEPIHVGGTRPWLCAVKLVGRTPQGFRRVPGDPLGDAGLPRVNQDDPDDERSSDLPPEPAAAGNEASDFTQTLLLRTGRGATADEARRDALAQLALVYGSPVGPAPVAHISELPPPSDEGSLIGGDAGKGWLDRVLDWFR
jgi:hypothetical protein